MIATLNKDQVQEVIAALVQALIAQNADAFGMLSPAQAAGMLDIAPKTLADIRDLPRITVIPRKYPLSP